MTRWHRPPLRVLVPGIVGFTLMIIAFVVETEMGSGSGRRYIPIHTVQLVGSALILLAAVISLTELKKNRKP
jgi:hypothetical protein